MVEQEVEELVELIKEGSVRNVTSSGNAKLQLPLPYVVVSTGPGGNNGQRLFNLYTHFPIGKDAEIAQYTLEELPRLVAMKKDIFGGNHYKPMGTYEGLTVSSDDNTLRMGISFYTILIVPRGANG